MKYEKATFLSIMLFFGCLKIALAQKIEVPQNYQFNDAADFKKYEPEFLSAVAWFEKTPWNQQRMTKMEVSDFLMDWIEGCPYVEVETSDDINELSESNYDLLVMYCAGYTRYVLQNPMDGSKDNARMAGMKALLAKYQVDKQFFKDKKVDRLVTLEQRGELAAWLSSELND